VEREVDEELRVTVEKWVLLDPRERWVRREKPVLRVPKACKDPRVTLDHLDLLE
jgi:hypothetical protein